MSLTPVTSATLNNMTSTVVKYPDPFYDLSKNYIPDNIKKLFKFCKTTFYTNGQLRNVINKMTQYPITDILFGTDIDAGLKEKYSKILHDNIKIKQFLIGVGMDYYTYGNSIITAFTIPKRFLRCEKCGNEVPMERVNFVFKNYKFTGKCQSETCNGAGTTFSVQDSKIRSISNFKLIRLNPENIDIDYDSLTGDSEYIYRIPNKIKKKIIIGDKKTLLTVPMAFIDAVKKKKAVLLDSNNIFHIKFPSLAEEDMGWAKPPILPALKEIYYLQTLRRGNEAIVNEHIVPKKSIFPSSSTGVDPFAKMNMGKWKGEIQEQLRKWKIDPNHIGVFPIPIGYQELGGNGRALMLTPEMKFLEESIINSLGVPLEFIKGGASWTGSSVSLRNVENGFLNYREHLLDLLNYFIIPKISGYLNIKPVMVHFKKFKMADDSEHKQLLLQLKQLGVISDRKVLEEFGIDYREEESAIKINNKSNLDSIVEQNRLQSISQGEAQVLSAKYQGQAQDELEAQGIKSKIKLFEEELLQELGNPSDDLFEVIEKITLGIKSMPMELQNQQLYNMYQQTPVTLTLVQERLGYYQAKDMQMMAEGQSMMGGPSSAAPNQQEPGTREGDKVDVSEKEKTKGQTRGTP